MQILTTLVGSVKADGIRIIRVHPRFHAYQTKEPCMSSPNITSVLKETRVFPPPEEFAAQAFVKSLPEYELLWRRAKDDPEGFCAERADDLHWFRRCDNGLAW